MTATAKDLPLSSLLLKISDELQTVASSISRTHGITSHLHWEAMSNHPEAVETIQELDHLEQIIRSLQDTLATMSELVDPAATVDRSKILPTINLARLAQRLSGDESLVTDITSGDVDLF